MNLIKTCLKFADSITQVDIAKKSPFWKYEKYYGYYHLEDYQVNECKYWSSYDKGIWFSCNNWRIGDPKDEGTEKCDIKAPGSSDQLPIELQGKWLYWNPDSKEWIKAGNDIIVKFSKELEYSKN